MSVNSQGVRSTIDFAKHVGAGPGILVDGNGLRRCIQKSGASPVPETRHAQQTPRYRTRRRT